MHLGNIGAGKSFIADKLSKIEKLPSGKQIKILEEDMEKT